MGLGCLVFNPQLSLSQMFHLHQSAQCNLEFPACTSCGHGQAARAGHLLQGFPVRRSLLQRRSRSVREAGGVPPHGNVRSACMRGHNNLHTLPPLWYMPLSSFRPERKAQQPSGLAIQQPGNEAGERAYTAAPAM